jgi:tetratricopeptide (TPR) repeat protein
MAARALAVLLLLLGACGTPQALRPYTADELRSVLRKRLTDVPEQDLVVPWEVNAQALERAREVAKRRRLSSERVRALVAALSQQDGFALRYTWAVHNSAAATLEAGGGTCMGLASLLVGLARGLGIEAYYVDASRNPERRAETEVNVVAGHIAAVAYTEEGPLVVDFTGQLLAGFRYRRISDLEAAAHYYNNLGYELIHVAEGTGQPVPWQEVSRQFARATRIAPGFARAWNNLGVASVRLGQYDRAERSYQQALRLDPRLESPRLNLNALVTSGVPLLSLMEPGPRGDGPLAPQLREDADVRSPDPAATEATPAPAPGTPPAEAP